jgi:hypothetical protein
MRMSRLIASGGDLRRLQNLAQAQQGARIAGDLGHRQNGCEIGAVEASICDSAQAQALVGAPKGG